MTATLIDPAVLFLNDHEGSCCDCCAGYCPIENSDPSWWESIYQFGAEYIGDPRLIVRSDALLPLPSQVEPAEIPMSWSLDGRTWATAPDDLPPLSTRGQSPRNLDRIDRAGLTLRDGEEVVHLYLGDRHVGWTMWAREGGVMLDELPLLREVASAGGIPINQASEVLNVVQAAAAAAVVQALRS